MDGPGRGGAEAAAHELLEQLVHGEEQREALHRSGGRILPLPGEEPAGLTIYVVKRRVGAVQTHRLAQRIRGIAHELQAGGKLSEPPAGIGRARQTGEPRHGCLQHAVQRRVLGPLLEAAGDQIGTANEPGHLPRHVQTTAQPVQVLLMLAIAARQPAADDREQPRDE